MIIDSQESIYSTAKLGAKEVPQWIGTASKGLGLAGAVITGGVAAKNLYYSMKKGEIGSLRDWANLGIGIASAAIILNPEALGVTELGEALWDTGTAVWDADQIGWDYYQHHK